jgi:RNA polymerase sigma-70 factor (ECF subfamily)
MVEMPVDDARTRAAARWEDAALLRRVGAGDEEALETLYQRYGAACYRLARRILDHPQFAEDVVQQVFLALWQGSGYDPARGAVSTWLLSVTHHKTVDLLRRESGRRSRLAEDQEHLEISATGPGPADQAWERLRAEHTREGLRTLSAEHREVLLLAYYGGYTQREIAEMTGLPLGTVKSRTLYAMRKLRVQPQDDVTSEEGQGR